MESPMLLKLSEEKELFSPPFEMSENEGVPTVYIKNRQRALKKLVRKTNAKDIIIEHGTENERIFQNRLKEYSIASPDVLLPVLESAFRACVQKHGIKIPLGEIYVVAPSPQACAVIYELHSLARLFTVISPLDAMGRMYDEIYFKHGTVIRHLPTFNNAAREDSLVIRVYGEKAPLWLKCPIIDMCVDDIDNARALSLANVHITDDFSRQFEKLWGGSAGAAFFSLLGKTPGINAKVNIDKIADRIFLLDTSKF